ncbi:hypothetical protein A2368_03145 [Candidatus Collierbacteria bacterium RIFOXYB1_FULL_49_13]|uniref:Uncharacterized protein n=1 Tax=Candidatus Collierbacteria bacterium RIFOXYB1_FULL_49_13 TaxID=1817728 RepID=A0A1F5FJY7_9BACT|nr:MAG: hypothetical protein A2368_03145 [Candidatus Collierbacteria bacterium RIFOXYB1_FULL_49_13]
MAGYTYTANPHIDLEDAEKLDRLFQAIRKALKGISPEDARAIGKRAKDEGVTLTPGDLLGYLL